MAFDLRPIYEKLGAASPRGKRGFSIVEALVALVFIGLVAAALGTLIIQSKKSERKARIVSLMVSLESTITALLSSQLTHNALAIPTVDSFELRHLGQSYGAWNSVSTNGIDPIFYDASTRTQCIDPIADACSQNVQIDFVLLPPTIPVNYPADPVDTPWRAAYRISNIDPNVTIAPRGAQSAPGTAMNPLLDFRDALPLTFVDPTPSATCPAGFFLDSYDPASKKASCWLGFGNGAALCPDGTMAKGVEKVDDYPLRKSVMLSEYSIDIDIIPPAPLPDTSQAPNIMGRFALICKPMMRITCPNGYALQTFNPAYMDESNPPPASPADLGTCVFSYRDTFSLAAIAAALPAGVVLSSVACNAIEMNGSLGFHDPNPADPGYYDFTAPDTCTIKPLKKTVVPTRSCPLGYHFDAGICKKDVT